MTENRIIANNGSSIVLYTADDGNTQLEVKWRKIPYGLHNARWQNCLVCSVTLSGHIFEYVI